MLSDGDYIDSLSLVGVTPEGNVILAQLLVTNLGMSPRVGVQFKWTDPVKGVIAVHKDEHPTKTLKVSEDGLTFTVAEKHVFRWDPATETAHVTMHHEKEKIKANLEFRAEGGGYKIGNGLVLFSPKRFQFLAYAAPRAIVTGTMQCGDMPVRDLAGTTGFISHAYQNMRAHHIACRWHMVKFHAHSAGLTVNVNVGVTPAANGHFPMANGVLVRGGKIEVCGTGASVEMGGFELDKTTGYHVPGNVTYRLAGKNDQGRDVSVSMPVAKPHLVEKLDILSSLPWILRQFLKAFIAKPYFYVFINEIEAVVSVEGQPDETVKGWLVHEIMFLNPDETMVHQTASPAKKAEHKQPEDKQPEDKKPEDKQPEDKQPEDKQPEAAKPEAQN